MAEEELNVDFIVKLGGSAVTHKDYTEMLNSHNLAEVAILLNQCYLANRTFIVVHGAGSFGHHHAKNLKVNEGYRHLDDKAAAVVKHGFCVTRKSVLKLNSLIVDSLLSLGVPAVGCSPCGQWVTENKAVKQHGVPSVASLLKDGFVPVIHGDCVQDTKLGCCILSGDTIIHTLCKEVHVNRVVFLTDVEGIFDRPPNEEGAQLLSKISVDKDRTHQTVVSTSQSENDVTGGIRFKLETAVDIVCNSDGKISVFVCQIGTPSAETICIHDELTDQTFTGTEVLLTRI
ncbi:isopentenyl phosphate kinase-like [Gigantopelta aegis]|uniref:isopentenyl phosphate kinase-like n=1 Tax=Gigantopelta aegis TaxID=1735272 RepID=UPI001B88BDE9|nr:isopentenyl phosphate kinase-like [Gigantopelta aegis]XP_041365790.1 isopentenyl phosphate kinase-like [Gigantopelta aegis]